VGVAGRPAFALATLQTLERPRAPAAPCKRPASC
jgi:hypothetical protein